MANTDPMRKHELVGFGPFQLNSNTRQLSKDGKPIGLGGRALDLLIFLVANAGDIVPKKEILAGVWPDVTIEDVTLRSHVAALRRILEDGERGARYIISVSGRGYSFVAPIHRSSPPQPTMDDNAGRSANGTTAPASIPSMSLVGRDEIIGKLSACLINRRFLSIVGPGGIGKTSVALAIVAKLRSSFELNAVHFLDLSTLTEPADLPGTVLSSVHGLATDENAEVSLIAHFREKRGLIVFDNCEHIIEAASQLMERLYEATSSLYIIATSREILRSEGETVHILLGLDVPQDALPSADDALAASAVQLFLARASGTGHTIGLDEGSVRVVVELCRRLDGIPLAIELAASRVGTYGVQGLLNLFETGPLFGFRGRRGASPRHQTLRDMLDWSFNILSVQEQELFADLSVFVGQFTLDAVRYVSSSSENGDPALESLLTTLVDKSLVVAAGTAGEVAFRLLETTRAYAAEKRHRNGNAAGLSRRHALYVVHCLESDASADRRGETTSERYEKHLGNVRKALAWALSEAGDSAIAVHLAIKASAVFMGLSLHAEYERWCRRAIDRFPSDGAGSNAEFLLLEAYVSVSMTVSGAGEDVRRTALRMVKIAAELKDEPALVHGYVTLAYVSLLAGQADDASDAARQALGTAQKNGQKRLKVMAHWIAGFTAHFAGLEEEAERQFDAGFSQDLDISSRPVLVAGRDLRQHARIWYARTLWLRGHSSRALKLVEKIVGDAEASGSRFFYGFSLTVTAFVYLWAEKCDTANSNLELALSISRHNTFMKSWAPCLALKSQAVMNMEKIDEGLAIAAEALDILTSNERIQLFVPFASSVYVPFAFASLAKGFAQQGRLKEAHEAIETALDMRHVESCKFLLPYFLMVRSEIFLAMGKEYAAQAEEYCLLALQTARAQSAVSWEIKATLLLADIWQHDQQRQEVRAMLGDLWNRVPEKSVSGQVGQIARMIEDLDHAGSVV